MNRCDCGGALVVAQLADENSSVHACIKCGTIWRIITEHEQALIDACKLPEIQRLVHKARYWGSIASDEAMERRDVCLEVLAPFEKLVPEE